MAAHTPATTLNGIRSGRRLSVRRALAALLAGCSLLVIAAAPPVAAQQLTAERLFASPEFRTEGLEQARWLDGGERFSYVERDPETRATHLWVEAVDGRDRTKLVDGDSLVLPGADRPLPIEGYQWSADERKVLIFTGAQRVWRDHTRGYYYVYDLETGGLTPVSRRPGWQLFAKLSPDGDRVGFVRENDLFVTDLGSGEEWRLTDDGDENIINGTFDWVYEEELGLQDGWRWSPDGQHIAFWQLDQSAIETFHLVDQLDRYNEIIGIRYPKAGTRNATARIGVVAASGGDITWIDIDKDSDGYIARMDWAASPQELVIQWLDRRQNRLEVVRADVRTGQTRFLFADTDEAWVEVDDHLTWIRDGAQLLWSSERDGYNHLYLYNRDGSLVRQITDGPWEVTAVHGVDEEEGRVYFTATEASPLERQLYRIRLDGTDLERVSEERGTHEPRLAPDFEHYIDVHSRIDTPPRTTLRQADGDHVRTLVENDDVRRRLRAAGALAPEFFTFDTRDGVELNGWVLKPPDFTASGRYPVLMYVYGGPGRQTVTDAWGGDRYLWHQLLAERGYLVVSVDNRGTGGRGAAFEKQVYLNLGMLESKDQIEAARYLGSLRYVDAERIGLWGWSYGGYVTLLTMGRGGELFKAGIAVAPVTDWTLYDTIYTERYMRKPDENPEGYRESAPLAYADDIEGALLLVHGTHDDNVHFQNATLMVNRLIAAGKQFEFMMYPNRTHALDGGATRVHLWQLMTDFVTERL